MEEWNATSERYICFIDIMGFTNYVYRNSHDLVKKRMIKLHEILDFSMSVVKKINKDFKQLENPIKTVIFSDSILLISKDKSIDSLDNILHSSLIVLQDFLKNKIPVKGAISYGKITADFDKSLFFGKAFIDAYKLQEELFMYGIILDHKVEKRMTKDLKFKAIYCYKGPVPTKSGSITHYSLNWPLWTAIMTNFDEKIDFVDNAIKNSDAYLEIIEDLYKDISGRPRKYIDNTKNFFNNAST